MAALTRTAARAAGTLASAARVPVWLAGIAGADKSFAKNPILGSPTLNRLGLHAARVQLAARIAEQRRARLAPLVDPADRAAFDRDGIVIKRDFLDPETFRALKDEIFGRRFAARELRQGQAVQRMVPLGRDTLPGLPQLSALVSHPALRGLTYYAASRAGEPVYYLQTVVAEPDGPNDPQTALHADTFHATTKGWFFLHDVAEEEGPFVYVPGSHRLTPERLAWERAQSVAARGHANSHHAAGSFRIREEDLPGLGYGAPVRVAVPANTLVIADTFGFHARAPSLRASTRVTVHTYIRRNPFLPWTGLDPKALPGLRGRELALYLGFQDLKRRLTGRGAPWRPVGPVTVDAPAQV
ncbi:Phytanoyl-CoA dioxygenase [Methylobacterium sp. 4-46]|uniref:phytanoyl-CoA dioxygenase family protein n=1 Tax=unclassified Methylobacterium TaxID=2615210 RepID=UPI000152C76F|nr:MULTISPECIES: phytanoyl-CoA dioxygenase family protein [Methylobacterium]ACA14893.1 Phytanoyl-CoA dioxygenase [Methylobacterium sp. 4-46]WFT80633.1 phytanoyl-CoA dioxygenase family protein [Methylobacterium nodulans]